MQQITPEMAKAELERRDKLTSSLTPQMAKAELAKRESVSRKTVPAMSGLDSAFTGFDTGVQRFTHGVLQPLYESGLFGEDIKKSSQNVAKTREEEFENAVANNPKTAKISEFLGAILGTSPLMSIPGVGQNALVRGLTQGLVQGGLMGGGQYVSGNDIKERGMNALFGAGIGSAAYPISKGLASPNPKVKAFTGGALGAGAGYMAGLDDHYKEIAAALAGAAIPFAPKMGANALTNLYRKSKSKITGEEFVPARTALQDLVTREIFPNANEEETKQALQRKSAGESIGVHITPAEAFGDAISGAAQGNVGKTKEGGKLLHEYAKGRLKSEKNAVKDLFKTIYPKDQGLYEREQELYKKAHGEYQKELVTIHPNTLNALTKDPVINDAMSGAIKRPAFAKELQDAPWNSLKYLDYTKRYIDDVINKAEGSGERNEARLLKKSKEELLSKLDEVSPEYGQAREIARRRIIRRELEEKLNDKEIRGTNFYQKFLRNDVKFEKLRKQVSNIPGAQQKLDWMRSSFQDIINPPTARTAAGLVKTKMVHARSSMEGLKDKVAEMLGGKYDKAAVELITNPHWDKELIELKKINDRDKRAGKLTDLLAKISTLYGTKKIADADAKKLRRLELETK